MKFFNLFFLIFLFSSCKPEQKNTEQPEAKPIQNKSFVKTGVQVLLENRLQELKGKKIALVTNASATLSGVLTADTLFHSGVEFSVIFAPEHGFRENLEAGKYFKDGKDPITGAKIISLYGKKKKPDASDLKNVDLVLFDIQDVGCRFYTYLTTLTYVMEACAQYEKPLWILDRPNPNGWYVSGPVLEKGFENFSGIHQIPIVHGMSLGEYARMVVGEKWLKTDKKLNLEVIKMQGWTHQMRWSETGLPWVNPSPNLRSPLAAEYYPITCWYEGTNVSVGRGTESPFLMIGAPWHKAFHKLFHKDSSGQTQTSVMFENLATNVCSFTPKPDAGAKNPMYQDEICYGLKFSSTVNQGDSLFLSGLLILENFYKEFNEFKRNNPNDTSEFFKDYFTDLSGSKKLREALEKKTPVMDIWKSWRGPIDAFKSIRQKYLLYPQ